MLDISTALRLFESQKGGVGKEPTMLVKGLVTMRDFQENSILSLTQDDGKDLK